MGAKPLLHFFRRYKKTSIFFALLITAGVNNHYQEYKENKRVEEGGFANVREMEKADRAGYSDKESYAEYLKEEDLKASIKKEEEHAAARKAGFISVDEMRAASLVGAYTKAQYERYLERQHELELIEIAEKKSAAEQAAAEQAAAEQAAAEQAAVNLRNDEFIEHIKEAPYFGFISTNVDYDYEKLKGLSCEAAIENLRRTRTRSGDFLVVIFVFSIDKQNDVIAGFTERKPKYDHDEVFGFSGDSLFTRNNYESSNLILDEDTGLIGSRKSVDGAITHYDYSEIHSGFVNFKIVNDIKRQELLGESSADGSFFVCAGSE